MLKRLSFTLILPALLAIAMPPATAAYAKSYGSENGVRLKAPLVRVEGVVERVFAEHGHHHGADHQHFVVRVARVLDARGMPGDAMAPLVFVALRFGDRDGLDQPIQNLRAGQRIELQGEYIDAAHAYRTQDNEGSQHLPVLHFTHHPVGYVLYNGHRYE